MKNDLILPYLRSFAFVIVPKMFLMFEVVIPGLLKGPDVKELITEQQADYIVMGLAILVTVISLGCGILQSRKLSKQVKKTLWANSILFAFAGPAIWIFWGIYNSIENYYGLDSVKALEINFGIVMAIAAFFMAIHWLIYYFMPASPKRSRS